MIALGTHIMKAESELPWLFNKLGKWLIGQRMNSLKETSLSYAK